MFGVALKLLVNRLNKVILHPCGPLKQVDINKVLLLNRMEVEAGIKNIRVFPLPKWAVHDVSP